MTPIDAIITKKKLTHQLNLISYSFETIALLFLNGCNHALSPYSSLDELTEENVNLSCKLSENQALAYVDLFGSEIAKSTTPPNLRSSIGTQEYKI